MGERSTLFKVLLFLLSTVVAAAIGAAVNSYYLKPEIKLILSSVTVMTHPQMAYKPTHVAPDR